MGCKYLIRTNEERIFPLQRISYTDYYISGFTEYLMLRFKKRGKIVFIQKWLY